MTDENTYKDTEFDNEFESDNDDEFNQDGNGWEESDENVEDPFECDPNEVTTVDDWPPVEIDEIDENDASEIENEFWKGYYEKTDTQIALKAFLNVIELIDNGGNDNDNYKFKSLTEIIILYFNNNANRDIIIKYFNEFLFSSNNVKSNDLSANLRKILNSVKANQSIYNQLYDLAMKHFKSIGNIGSVKHLWFNLGLERCHNLLEQKVYKRCEILIEELHKYLKINDKDDTSDTAKLLQVYAVKIQLTMGLIDNLACVDDSERDMDKYDTLQQLLRNLIEITQNIVTGVAITDNKSMSIIYECWAKVYASNNDWYNSYKYFKEAFLLYQQIAHKNTTKCLKYLLISYMILSSLDTERDNNNSKTQLPNPFDMDEIKVYENHNDIIIINNLLNAFEEDNINQFNILLKQQYDNDLFINKYLLFVQLRLQGKALINLVQSYDRVKLQWLGTKLGMNMNDLEKLIVNLIVNCELNGRLDQVDNILILKERNNKQNAILDSLNNWLKTVNNLRNSINSRVAQKSTQSFGGRGGGFGLDNDYGMDYDDDIYFMDSAYLSWD